MKPIEPRYDGRTQVYYAALQPAFKPLPATVSDDAIAEATTEWMLDDTERNILATGGVIQLKIRTFGDPLQPVKLDVLTRESFHNRPTTVPVPEPEPTNFTRQHTTQATDPTPNAIDWKRAHDVADREVAQARRELAEVVKERDELRRKLVVAALDYRELKDAMYGIREAAGAAVHLKTRVSHEADTIKNPVTAREQDKDWIIKNKMRNTSPHPSFCCLPNCPIHHPTAAPTRG